MLRKRHCCGRQCCEKERVSRETWHELIEDGQSCLIPGINARMYRYCTVYVHTTSQTLVYQYNCSSSPRRINTTAAGLPAFFHRDAGQSDIASLSYCFSNVLFIVSSSCCMAFLYFGGASLLTQPNYLPSKACCNA